MENIEIFKDWLERDKMKKNIELSKKALECWQEHKEIEFESRSFLEKIAEKSMIKLRKIYLQIYFRFIILKNYSFYI